MTHKRIIFLSGKITGDPDYKAHFADAEQFYKNKGYIVLNPAKLPEGMAPEDYMRICFAMIDTADEVVFLDGSSESRGSVLEYKYCEYTGKEICLYDAVIALEPKEDRK